MEIEGRWHLREGAVGRSQSHAEIVAEALQRALDHLDDGEDVIVVVSNRDKLIGQLVGNPRVVRLDPRVVPLGNSARPDQPQRVSVDDLWSLWLN